MFFTCPTFEIWKIGQNLLDIDVNISIKSHFDGNYDLIIASRRMTNFHSVCLLFSRHYNPPITSLYCVIARLCHIGHGFLTFSLIIYYWNQKEKYAVIWCNFIIRNYIQTELEIGTIVMSLRLSVYLKTSIFSLLLSHVKKGWKCPDFLGVQRQNYGSD